jgi:hypothetical protein
MSESALHSCVSLWRDACLLSHCCRGHYHRRYNHKSDIRGGNARGQRYHFSSSVEDTRDGCLECRKDCRALVRRRCWTTSEPSRPPWVPRADKLATPDYLGRFNWIRTGHNIVRTRLARPRSNLHDSSCLLDSACTAFHRYSWPTSGSRRWRFSSGVILIGSSPRQCGVTA